MPTLVSKKTTQEYTLDEIKKLICLDLGVAEQKVTIEPIKTADPGDIYDRGPTTYSFTGIRVTIDNLA